MNAITLTWNGHSCFTVETDGFSIVLDPYAPDSVPGLSPLALTANQVLCSHEHSDHGFLDAVTLKNGQRTSPFTVTAFDTYHDDQKGALRGANKIHLLKTGEIRAAHLGDLGCELTGEQVQALSRLDVLMIPVGGYYTIDAAQAKAVVDLLKPRIAIPMHYRSDVFGYPVIGRLEDFTSLCRNVTVYGANHIAVTKKTEPQTAVLSYM